MEIGNAARDGFAQLANTPYTVGSTASVLCKLIFVKYRS